MLVIEKQKLHPKTNRVFVFQTHVVNKYIRERLEQLVDQVSGVCDVYVLLAYPNKISKNSLKLFLEGLDVGIATYNMFDLFEATYGFRQDNRRKAFYIIEHIPLVCFLELFPCYDFLWRCEYDVLYTGDWGNLVQHFSDTNSDFISTNIFNYYGSKPHWNHWWRSRSFEDFKDNPIQVKDMVRSHNGVCSISKPFSKILRANVLNFRAHYEVTLGTIANLFDLSIRDIGGLGSYTLACDKGKYYITDQDLPNSDNSAGTFNSHGNYFGQEDYMSDFLYHPVKATTADYDY
tara:strand:+ start:61 stop:930 length:870 start_codon:yes stop_codon:yes gene_type:complete